MWRRGQWQQRRLLQLPCAAKPWEEKRGKKNKYTVTGILASQRHFTYPPFSHLSCQQIRCQISRILYVDCRNSADASAKCTTPHFADLYWENNYTFLLLSTLKSKVYEQHLHLICMDTIEGDTRKGAQQHLPHTPPFRQQRAKEPRLKVAFLLK